MRKENRSLAKNFKICDGDRPKPFVEFIVNVNTSAERRPPRYSHVSVCEMKSNSSSSHFLLALKTEKSIAILKLINNQASMVHQLEFGDRFIGKSFITYHTFVERSIMQGDHLSMVTGSTSTTSTNTVTSPDILVGFSNGTILVMNALTKRFKYQFNTASEKSEAPWHVMSPKKIQYIPYKNTFLVLFTDSTFIEYSLNELKENFEVQEDITKHINSLSFIPKKLAPAVSKKSAGSFDFSSMTDPAFVGYACYPKEQANSFSGPNFICKFKCPAISDFAVLPRSHPLSSRLFKQKNRVIDLLVFSGLDGILRVVDINNFLPVYSFKTYYGGINGFAIDESSTASPLLTLDCQDDSVVLLNTTTEMFWRIQGHTSFVTRSSLHYVHAEGRRKGEEQQSLIRVIAASLDGSISITDFERDEVLSEDAGKSSEGSNVSLRKLDADKARDIPPNRTHFQKVNEEGVAFELGFADYFLTSSFDGCVSIFRFQTEQPKELLDDDTSSTKGQANENGESYTKKMNDGQDNSYQEDKAQARNAPIPSYAESSSDYNRSQLTEERKQYLSSSQRKKNQPENSMRDDETIDDIDEQDDFNRPSRIGGGGGTGSEQMKEEVNSSSMKRKSRKNSSSNQQQPQRGTNFSQKPLY